jgi:hypothetical protein
LALACAGGVFGDAQAGAWTMPKGRGQAITTLTFYRSQGGFDDQGQPVPAARFQRTEAASYLEYGITKGLTVGAEPRYELVASGVGPLRNETRGPGDLDLFARQHILKYGPWLASVQALVKLPLYSRARQPLPGNGFREYEFRVALGRPMRLLWPGAFIDSEIAYRRGTGGLADQIRTDITVGVRPAPRFLVLLKGYRTRSLGIGGGTPGASYDLDKAEVSGVLRVTRTMSLELGAERDFAGERVGLGTAVHAAVWLRF